MNNTDANRDYEKAEEEHEYDAVTALLLNVTIIGCLLLAYYVKKFRIYTLPESAGALLVGIAVGGIARLSTDNLQLWEFSPEVFFFVLLPPIIFEAGYSLKRKDFFDNIGAITLYAMFGTIISTFVVGGLSFYAARLGLIQNVDHENPMESLLFGSLISAVDPVATLSILGSDEIGCSPQLYYLCFGEAVLNDAVAISLFHVFARYYKQDGPEWSEAEIPSALLYFMTTSILSIGVGVGLGLLASFLFKHTELSRYPNLETSLLFSFCYLCYATGEAVGLSGIMALFFQGVVLSHYNAYNLSPMAHVASEQIFATLATISETAVFLYMGMGVFTGRFENYDFRFAVLALVFCWLGRMLNIFPLSWLANRCRNRSNKIPIEMQCVLWFAGLRGAIAFALAMNMPGPNKDAYASATLSICIFTTVVCGGLTEGMLTAFDMKQRRPDTDGDEGMALNQLSYTPTAQASPSRRNYPLARRASAHFYRGGKRIWKQLDDEILKPYFGGSDGIQSSGRGRDDQLGNYELGHMEEDTEEEEEEEEEDAAFVNG
jgi:sodium/hydrogen exchanger 8